MHHSPSLMHHNSSVTYHGLSMTHRKYINMHFVLQIFPSDASQCIVTHHKFVVSQKLLSNRVLMHHLLIVMHQGLRT